MWRNLWATTMLLVALPFRCYCCCCVLFTNKLKFFDNKKIKHKKGTTIASYTCIVAAGLAATVADVHVAVVAAAVAAAAAAVVAADLLGTC